MAPEYDVVVPAFREAAYIGGLLAGLGRQTVKPHCVIVALYGDGDGTRGIAERMGARVATVGKPGIGYARAVGCARADAPYILNIDADSVPEPDAAERLLSPLESGEAVMTHGFGQWRDGEAPFLAQVAFGVASMAKHLVPGAQCYSGMMIAREAYEKVGGFLEVVPEDLDLSFRVALAYPFMVKYVPEAVVWTSARRWKGLTGNILAGVDYSKAYRGSDEIDVG